MTLGAASKPVAVDAPDQAGDLDRVVDRDPTRPEALPRLVEQGGERVVHVEMAGRDRQVGRLERAAALLLDDVERADDPDVVAEVGEVARPPAAVEVGDEGRVRRPRRRRDGVPPRVTLRAGLRAWRTNSAGARATDASTSPSSSRTLRRSPIDGRPRARRSTSSARSPRTSTPISRRIRSEARWIASTWSALRISTGRSGLTIDRQGSRGSPVAARRARVGAPPRRSSWIPHGGTIARRRGRPTRGPVCRRGRIIRAWTERAGSPRRSRSW